MAPLMTNFTLIAFSRFLRHAALPITLLLVLLAPSAMAQTQETLATPVGAEWCKSLPRAEYKALERVQVAGETWFEVYKVAPNTFAIYEPHQSEETIAYLISGPK